MGRKYFFRKRHLAMAQALIDSVGSVFFRRKRKMPARARKILISRIDHLGDVLLASSVVPHIKKAYPDAEVHFLAGSWAKDILSRVHGIDKIIFFDSAHKRGKRNFREALREARSVIARLREENYCAALDLRAYPLNSILLLYLGRVRFIAGFETGGFGFLLDRAIPCEKGEHEMERLKKALDAIGAGTAESLKPSFAPTPFAIKKAQRLLESMGVRKNEPFVLAHTGSGSPVKLWDREGWQELICRLSVEGINVIVHDDIYRDLEECFYLPPGISIEEFASIAMKSSFFIGLDSMPAHLAASFSKPVMVIWCGVNDHLAWRPAGESVFIIRKDISCSPCHRKDGCAGMECMDISPDDVCREMGRHLRLFNRELI